MSSAGTLNEAIVGSKVSTITLPVLGKVYVRSASLPAISPIVPPLRSSGEVKVGPLLSLSPKIIVYLKVNVLVPDPDRLKSHDKQK